MVRAAMRASSLVRAPVTSTTNRWVAPSPSRASRRVSCTHTSSSPALNASASGVPAVMTGFPAAPLASTTSESLVLLSPSTVSIFRE